LPWSSDNRPIIVPPSTESLGKRNHDLRNRSTGVYQQYLLGSDIDRLFGLAIDLGYAVHLPHPEGGRPEPLTDENRPDSRYVYNVVLARPEALDAVWD